ncbi:kirola-like [Solanum tuberosum]|uniref:Sn-2 protein n=1 Tax=Solanum tuberosum TaxID=4113 RepID=M1BAS4_SOLTU|nr:PREDICTED: kirola-like [Solanum tuberosum]
MGVKGKLIASIEVRCGGHSIHDMFHTNTHHIPNINPTKYKHFEIHEGETIKVGSIVSWKYNQDGKEKFIKQVIEVVDSQNKSITWKVIEGNVLELYNSLIVITSSEHQWTTLTFVYEKKTGDTPEPLTDFGFFLDAIKDMEDHLIKI